MKKFLAAVSLIMIITCLSACKSAGDKLAYDGAKAFGEGRYSDAIELLTQADEKGLSTYKGFELDLMLAESYLKIGNYEETIAICDKVIAENASSGHYRAYNLKGLALKNSGEYEKALESYKNALTFDKKDLDSSLLYNNIGNVYISLNEPLQAIDYLQEAIILNPDFAESYGNIAIAYAILFDFDSADAALSDAEAKGYDKVAEVEAIIDKYRGFDDYLATSETEVTTTAE
ncbi:MAG: tetratricopeptide repeat protein [Ruminococcus sp.]|jgi:tetratricopeptide (TPR) repeat protein|nr:tetratricopeptide repeat protein [Ruminococcus sp.]